MRSSLRVAVIGGGPAGLIAAERLAQGGCAVDLYDRMPSLGRKFLMAGRGGLNITHSEPFERFLTRYGPLPPLLENALLRFPPETLRRWCTELGETTFVGSSGRVFPHSLKASPLLRAWLERLRSTGVRFHTRHDWRGWAQSNALRFATPAGEITAQADAVVLALGGASWPKLGADGSWTGLLAGKGVALAPLQPSNVGARIAWSEHVRVRFAGQPLKRIALSVASHTRRGEVVVTEGGLEGGALYALTAPLRAALAANGTADLHVDLRPDLSRDELAQRLCRPRNAQSASTFLRKAAGLAPVSIALLREAGPLPEDAAGLADRIKNLPLAIIGLEGLDRAISTAGGIRFDGLDERFMLRALPGTFAAGEMLDWEAPTGGYLLQACFATGLVAAEGVLAWAETADRSIFLRRDQGAIA